MNKPAHYLPLMSAAEAAMLSNILQAYAEDHRVDMPRKAQALGLWQRLESNDVAKQIEALRDRVEHLAALTEDPPDDGDPVD